MELISIGYIRHIVDRQYGKFPNIRAKINKYFDNFFEKYSDLKYVWLEDKLYIESYNKNKIKKDIEQLLNKPINKIHSKIISSEVKIKFITSLAAKKKLERKKHIKKKEIEKKNKKIKKQFFSVVDNIKSNKDGFKKIGCFDLEFWENNMNIILEFGWRIEDYASGKGHTTHLIIQENLNYKNQFYSQNNRFARNDSKMVSLKTAKEKFINEFLSEIDIMVGHGLTNDFKVLQNNGVSLKKRYLDTSDIGSVIMYENEKVSLERLLEYLRIKHVNLHNAANDVECILKAFFEMGDL